MMEKVDPTMEQFFSDLEGKLSQTSPPGKATKIDFILLFKKKVHFISFYGCKGKLKKKEEEGKRMTK